MKSKLHVISSFILMTFFLGCNFNYTERGNKVDLKNDGSELLLAKKSLKFIAEDNTAALKELLNDDILKKTKHEQLEWIFTNGKRIMENNEYPHDSIITVSYTTKKYLSKEETFKEFNFPFINENYPDSTKDFQITISNGEIYKLTISYGMQFQKTN